MRRTVLLVCFCLLIGVSSCPAQSQQHEKKARRILSDVSRRYAKLTTLEAHFNFTLVNPQDHLNETQSGSLITQPSTNRYRVRLPSQELFSDGRANYTWLKTQKEIQISALDSNNESINPARIFSVYEKGFKYQYRQEVNEGGRKLDLIDLVPIKSKKIVKAQVAIIRHVHHIYRIRLFDKNGSQLTYTITEFSPDTPLKGDEFTFDKKNYPGVEVVDLR